jgi:predicted Zn-dependent protease with MMP-like domain
MVEIKVEVEEEVKQKCIYDFEGEIKRALTVIPSEHLQQLSEIIVQSEARKHSSDALGSYYGKSESTKSPYVIIYAKNILARFPHAIPLLSGFCFRLYLRDTLYHEIAHHYQRISHGYNKMQWESHANKYSVKMQIRKYKESMLGKIIFRIVFFIKLIFFRRISIK